MNPPSSCFILNQFSYITIEIFSVTICFFDFCIAAFFEKLAMSFLHIFCLNYKEVTCYVKDFPVLSNSLSKFILPPHPSLSYTFLYYFKFWLHLLHTHPYGFPCLRYLAQFWQTNLSHTTQTSKLDINIFRLQEMHFAYPS